MTNSVWQNIFRISINDRHASPNYQTIANLETVEMAIDGNVVDWFALDAQGFARNMITAKKIAFNCAAKLTPGDAGNDYVAGKMLSVGSGARSMFQLTFPTGAVLFGNCNINVTSGLGAAEDVDALEFEILVDGAPIFAVTASNNLTALVLTTATLFPTFAGGVFEYVATTSVASVTVTPTFAAGVCTITVNSASQNVASGVASSAISAGVVGTVTLITIVVQETNRTPRTYNVHLTRTA